MFPAIGKVLYITFLNFALVDEIKLGADDDDKGCPVGNGEQRGVLGAKKVI